MSLGMHLSFRDTIKLYFIDSLYKNSNYMTKFAYTEFRLEFFFFFFFHMGQHFDAHKNFPSVLQHRYCLRTHFNPEKV